MKLPEDIAGYKQLVEHLLLIIDQQQATIKRLELRVSELEARLNQNSRNSHRPPSSDGPRKPAALPKEPKARGGQPGHKGDTLKMVAAEEVDHHVALPALRCECGADLRETEQWLRGVRQVFDLPEPKLEVTQYEQFGCLCPSCGAEAKGEFPAHVKAAVQYGPRLRTAVTLFNVEYNLPLDKIEQLTGELWGQHVNETTVQNAVAEAFEALEPTEMATREALKAEPVVHVDETGLRVAGTNHWLHTCSSAGFTHLMVHPNRGKKAIMSEESLVVELKEFLVHDCLLTYFALKKPRHALCNAHILRELQALIEQGRPWAEKMHKFLLEMFVKSKRGTKIYPQWRRAYSRYDKIVAEALETEPPPSMNKRGKPSRSKGRNLAERMAAQKEAILAFIRHPMVPFTNNQAERDIRPAKTKIKVSGCFRTLRGATHYARIRAFASTARKQGINPFDQLLQTMLNPLAVGW